MIALIDFSRYVDDDHILFFSIKVHFLSILKPERVENVFIECKIILLQHLKRDIVFFIYAYMHE